jgi:uncharacterized protein with von Willebrand factor type A (vWA) domain
MDWHIKISEELFSAARAEFKHMEYFYFHNCLYEWVWRNNARRHTERMPTWDVCQRHDVVAVAGCGDGIHWWSLSTVHVSARVQ